MISAAKFIEKLCQGKFVQDEKGNTQDPSVIIPKKDNSYTLGSNRKRQFSDNICYTKIINSNEYGGR